MLFSNHNEFLRDSSRIEPIPPNIHNDIVSESEMTRSSSRLEKKKLQIPPKIRKKSIRGNSGDSWPVWNKGIRYYLFFVAEYEIRIHSALPHKSFNVLSLILSHFS